MQSELCDDAEKSNSDLKSKVGTTSSQGITRKRKSILREFGVNKVLGPRPDVDFCTGSNYKGEWDKLGLAGEGSYIMPHGVEYIGPMVDGQIHGEGRLMQTDGGVIYGEWVHGKPKWLRYVFPDGLQFEEENWSYCKMPDRRFYKSIKEGLNAACDVRKSNRQPIREIPEGCLDTEEGFYETKSRRLRAVEDSWKLLRVPPTEEIEWILKHCRREWTENIGFSPDLFEEWQNVRKYSRSTADLLRLENEKGTEEYEAQSDYGSEDSNCPNCICIDSSNDVSQYKI